MSKDNIVLLFVTDKDKLHTLQHMWNVPLVTPTSLKEVKNYLVLYRVRAMVFLGENPFYKKVLEFLIKKQIKNILILTDNRKLTSPCPVFYIKNLENKSFCLYE